VSHLKSAACERKVLKDSAQIVNKYREKGSPWRISNVGVKISVGCPFISKENQTVEIHWIIKSQHFFSKTHSLHNPKQKSSVHPIISFTHV
jgi:hypothetical protein